MTIYLLEDNEIYSKSLVKILEKCTPYSISNSFSKGSDLLNVLKSGKVEGTIPDLILLDLSLPDMSGWEVLDSIKEFGIRSAVIIISISTSSSDIEKANDYSNVVGYYNKGAFPADLIDMIHGFNPA